MSAHIEAAWGDADPRACTPDLRIHPPLTWEPFPDNGWRGTYHCPDCGASWDTAWGHDMNGETSA
jgi:hypothetical protein